MKLYQKMIIVLLSLIMLLNAFLFVTGLVVQDFFRQAFSYVALQDIDLDKPLDDVLGPLQLPEMVVDVIKEESHTWYQTLLEDEAFQSYVTQYSEQLLKNVADPQARIPEINRDIKEMIDQQSIPYEGMLKEWMDVDDVKELFYNLIDMSNPQSLYQTFVETLRGMFTPAQYAGIQIVYYLTTHNIIWICSAVWLLCIVGMLLITRCLTTWLLPVGIVGIAAGSIVMVFHTFLIYGVSITDNMVVTGIISCAKQWDIRIGSWYLIIGIISLLLYIGLHAMHRQQENHPVPNN